MQMVVVSVTALYIISGKYVFVSFIMQSAYVDSAVV